MILDSKFVRWIHAGAFTVCPIVFVDPDIRHAARVHVLRHEFVHMRQQLWFGVVGALLGALVWVALGWPIRTASVVLIGLGMIEGWVAGQLLWRALYLLVLPVKWNPWRRKWETAAYRAQGVDESEIREILRRAPYYLA